MTTHDVAVRPETARDGICPHCGGKVWWVTAVAGAELSLDLFPDPDLGTVEMVALKGVYQACVLAQCETLFPVDERLRWRSHAETCTRSRTRRGDVPKPRSR